jgi:hypothetical protein
MSRTLRCVAAAALTATVLPALGGSLSGAAGDDPLYSPLSSFEPSGEKVAVTPDSYHAVRVDLDQARAELEEGTVFPVPTPTGGTERFAIHPTRVMEAELAAAHPEITTYAGRSLDHPETTIALDITPMGLHAAVRGPQGQGAWYVDPAYDRPGTTAHLSYYGGDVPRAEEEFVEREAPEIRTAMRERRQTAARAGAPVTQKVYRLAFVNDPTYAKYFGTANVLAAKNTLINRVNQIYNADLGIKMVLIAETPKLNLDTPAKATRRNGPCGAHPCFERSQLEFCNVPTLGRNRVVLGQLVGASNYDIGHIGLGVKGGGIAYLGVAGSDYKGGGCTGLDKPRGDVFAIDYVAHELGHQFSGNHTFNGVNGSCAGGSRNRRTSVEPGSGSSVMAYAGICRRDDLQPHTDPYFSGKTLDEVNAYTRARLPTVAEVQTVSLRGFTNGKQITLDFEGADNPVTLTRGPNYTRAKVEAALEMLTGMNVSVAGWGYDYLNDPRAPLNPDSTGFQVTFARSLNPEARGVHTDQPNLTITDASPDVSWIVGETAKGGPAGNRGSRTVSTNTAPVVRAPANKTIPMRTPFTLTGSGRDADGHRLTYLWEQMDIGGRNGTALLSNTKRNGPLFRVFGRAAKGLNIARTSPSRTFPDLAQILRGNTNAKTGTCPRPSRKVSPRIRDCFSEFLPIKGYVGTAGSKTPAMHFRLTARDGFARGGGVGRAQVTLRIRQNAGPFLVTSFARGGKVRPGSKQVVEWEVNGTRPLARNVRILLSTDGGRTWRTMRKSTANDGAAVVRFARKKTSNARIMIAANGNYFFDVNDNPFRIRR